jgi:hypothetical protein
MNTIEIQRPEKESWCVGTVTGANQREA